MQEYLGINIDYSRDRIIPEQGLRMLTARGFYKKSWEKSPQESYARAATSYCFGDYDLAQRIYDAVSKQWFTFASPVLTNAVELNWPNNFESFEEAGDWLEDNLDEVDGLPISCFLNAIGDSKQSLVANSTETKWLSMSGGGIGVYFGNRAPDEKSTGVMAHLATYDAYCKAYRQTESRRGSIAAYMDVDHPEIMTFLQTRNPAGGDPNSKNFNVNIAVNITDKFMKAVISGEEYELIDPKHGNTGRYLKAREVWEEIHAQRYETGQPYISYIDTINRNKPEQITNPLYNVKQSNLCSEITLMTDEDRTAVCCLSSLNLEKFDEWKDSTLVEDLVTFLDNVLEYFIRMAPEELSRAVYSARMERALGLGTLGWHSYLQSKLIPFESGGMGSAIQHTHKVYGHIKAKAVEQSKRLAGLRGEAPDCRGSGFRNSHLLAIAPNASSSSLVNVSPSIELWAANAFTAEGRAGAFLIKNKYLEAELEKLDMNTPEVWAQIVAANGSVQGIDGIPDDIKLIFKTALEVDQAWVIEGLIARQPYLCQSQSANIATPPGTTLQYVSDLAMKAWAGGVKTLYYNRADTKVKASVSKEGSSVTKIVHKEVDFNECLACEG